MVYTPGDAKLSARLSSWCSFFATYIPVFVSPVLLIAKYRVSAIHIIQVFNVASYADHETASKVIAGHFITPLVAVKCEMEKKKGKRGNGKWEMKLIQDKLRASLCLRIKSGYTIEGCTSGDKTFVSRDQQKQMIARVIRRYFEATEGGKPPGLMPARKRNGLVYLNCECKLSIHVEPISIAFWKG